MEDKKDEGKISVKENLKSLDKQTKKTLFNVIVVSACGLFFVILIHIFTFDFVPLTIYKKYFSML